MMPVRVTLTLLVDAKSPSDAAKLLEPVLANMPAVEQFSLSIKGDGFFTGNGLRKSKVQRRAVATRDY